MNELSRNLSLLVFLSPLIFYSSPLSTGPTCLYAFTMPEHHTRQVTSDKLKEAVNHLTQGQASLNQNHNNLNTKMDSLNAKINLILDRLATITVTPPSPSSSPHPPPSPAHRPHMKLDVPRFNGHDPLGWIFKISQFFDYQGIPNHEHLTVATFYMDGPSLPWYQWMSRNDYFLSWSTMLQALESRFAPSFYEDPQGALFELQQTSTVTEYLMEFEHLAN